MTAELSHLRPSCFWVVKRRWLALSYRSFGTAYRSHLQGYNSPSPFSPPPLPKPFSFIHCLLELSSLTIPCAPAPCVLRSINPIGSFHFPSAPITTHANAYITTHPSVPGIILGTASPLKMVPTGCLETSLTTNRRPHSHSGGSLKLGSVLRHATDAVRVFGSKWAVLP